MNIETHLVSLHIARLNDVPCWLVNVGSPLADRAAGQTVCTRLMVSRARLPRTRVCPRGHVPVLCLLEHCGNRRRRRRVPWKGSDCAEGGDENVRHRGGGCLYLHGGGADRTAPDDSDLYPRGVEGGVDDDMSRGNGSVGRRRARVRRAGHRRARAQWSVRTPAETWMVPPRLACECEAEGMREGAGDKRTYVRYSPWPFGALEVTESREYDASGGRRTR